MRAFESGRYWCDPDGNVFSWTRTRKPKELRLTPSGSGYFRFALIEKRGDPKVDVYAHHAVWLFFMGRTRKGLEINHIDANKINNALENLELVTRSQNILHARKIGIFTGAQKLTEPQVKKIKKLWQGGVPRQVIANQFKCTPEHVWAINVGKITRWKHVQPC